MWTWRINACSQQGISPAIKLSVAAKKGTRNRASLRLDVVGYENEICLLTGYKQDPQIPLPPSRFKTSGSTRRCLVQRELPRRHCWRTKEIQNTKYETRREVKKGSQPTDMRKTRAMQVWMAALLSRRKCIQRVKRKSAQWQPQPPTRSAGHMSFSLTIWVLCTRRPELRSELGSRRRILGRSWCWCWWWCWSCPHCWRQHFVLLYLLNLMMSALKLLLQRFVWRQRQHHPLGFSVCLIWYAAGGWAGCRPVSPAALHLVSCCHLAPVPFWCCCCCLTAAVAAAAATDLAAVCCVLL